MGSNSAKPPADAKYSQQELNQNQNQPQVQQPYMGSNQDPKNPNINQQQPVQVQSDQEREALQKLVQNSKEYDIVQQNLIDRLNELDTAMGTFTKGLKAKNDIQEEINKAEERRVEQM